MGSRIAGADWTLFVIAGMCQLFLSTSMATSGMTSWTWRLTGMRKSGETGRDRPLVFGWATVDEYRKMSAVIVVIVIILAAYLTTQRVLIPVLIVLGLCFRLWV